MIHSILSTILCEFFIFSQKWQGYDLLKNPIGYNGISRHGLLHIPHFFCLSSEEYGYMDMIYRIALLYDLFLFCRCRYNADMVADTDVYNEPLPSVKKQSNLPILYGDGYGYRNITGY